ncbi:MAG: mannose-6-phosphate isomerase, class I [Saprospiraceae bacterium]|jgi:mannose-6-phosphate isomerase|nr:mannose-6-phosphate isomerase, class I [Saprospiraceae bacterium]
MSQIFALEGVVQHYAWGGTSFIPDLSNIDNTNNQPFAELWMGTHHRGPSSITREENTWDLRDYLKEYPQALGHHSIKKFGSKLPFLFKILDVNTMLSIQSHPTKKQAEIGFSKENELGIPLTAKHRNYKDDNHKPELMVALTDFWLLHGFQSIAQIDQIVKKGIGFESLGQIWEKKSIVTLYQYIMELPQEEINQLLKPLHQVLLSKEEQLQKNQADFWALKAFQQYTSPEGNYDRGIFSIYLFNLVFIKKGDAIFQDAGIPHAYLEGVNVEIMANSDNVFRGGLTPKHVDVSALMGNLVLSPIVPKIIEAETISATEMLYPTPAPDFGLSQIHLKPGLLHQETSQSAQICIVMEGTVIAEEQQFSKGQSFFIPAATNYQLSAKNETIIFKAFVP